MSAETLNRIRLTVNGVDHDLDVPDRKLLSDVLRQDLELTGTHVGCEHGVCGACTVQFDGVPVRSCLVFAASAQGHEVTTVEGIGNDPEHPSPVQQAFIDCHGLQCGFCTPGFITTIDAFIKDNPHPTEEESREVVSGNLCRCTGYQNIVKAVQRAAELQEQDKALAAGSSAPSGSGGCCGGGCCGEGSAE
ncbi:(2Fe-2S)-binding protein [Brevibacterium sp. 50QC2O2]|jgi:carbon-monoxide dehydrogenase small subunit|uniref:(2Fe-2S)-binding protein n=1 Tax=Brevibacterium TaxID=1696 RepID=UPI00211C7FD0|nr:MULTISPECIES: (2Fe-2S)-binding protein [unclassified Brevibacterium]MCQ9368804.1 (2Fe-2S)-binding protein [Brevibacterium sp. 91QC2O2]MCQ9386188.1 (2Fe-2S)-binding protein [Brevibacterium sp. 68QC2CO]MCQ9388551.1 (2Fe-2S)-binding protein [Brevibacterium sp. 50QC2O2]